MARIGLTEGFSVIPEGTHIFKITDVNYKEAFGKLEVSMVTQKGQKHIERFSLLRNDGSPNEGAYNAFSYFAKTALNDYTLTEIDHTDLVGHFIECDVEHDIQPNKNNPEKTVTFARLTDKRPSKGWNSQDEDLPTPSTKTAPAAFQVAKNGSVDLKAILG